MLSLVAADFLPLLCCEFPGVGGGCVGGPQVTVTGPSAGPGTAPVELQTNLRELEVLQSRKWNLPTMAFSAATAFTLLHLLRHYILQAVKHSK